MRAWLWAAAPEAYAVFEQTRTFALHRVGRPRLAEVQPGDVIFAYLTGAQVLAGMFEVTAPPFEDDTPLVRGRVLPHRVRVRPIVTLPGEARLPIGAFADRLQVAADYPDVRRVVQQVLYPLPRVDEKLLAFLLHARSVTAPEKAIAAYETYLASRAASPGVAEPGETYTADEPAVPFSRADALEALITFIEGRGFVYAPWQVAAFVAALRTKGFAILAGITGTGKSRLPLLVAAGTGAQATLLPVRPDWTDSAQTLGYTDLQGRFRPGEVLTAARDAMASPARYHLLVLDEMNLSRVEQYLAEVLSHIEGRTPSGRTLPLVPAAPDEAWAAVTLPPNLALVGTVNVDESTHAFSRKVLDRAFTLELSEVDLAARPAIQAVQPQRWPVEAWQPRARTLAALETQDETERLLVEQSIEALVGAHAGLVLAGGGIAYRTRDEVALFVVHAHETPDAFRTRGGTRINPLDLALALKVLPRITGSRATLEKSLLHLMGWAWTDAPLADTRAARRLVSRWEEAGRPLLLVGARFPLTAARLCRVWNAVETEGFASFWDAT